MTRLWPHAGRFSVSFVGRFGNPRGSAETDLSGGRSSPQQTDGENTMKRFASVSLFAICLATPSLGRSNGSRHMVRQRTSGTSHRVRRTLQPRRTNRRAPVVAVRHLPSDRQSEDGAQGRRARQRPWSVHEGRHARPFVRSGGGYRHALDTKRDDAALLAPRSLCNLGRAPSCMRGSASPHAGGASPNSGQFDCADISAAACGSMSPRNRARARLRIANAERRPSLRFHCRRDAAERHRPGVSLAACAALCRLGRQRPRSAS